MTVSKIIYINLDKNKFIIFLYYSIDDINLVVLSCIAC